MKYFITRLDRTVELDDILVQKYCEYENLREQPFSIVIKSKFGHKPTKEEISDEELSKICNEILLSELKALGMLPNALHVLQQHYYDIQNASKNGNCINFSLQKERETDE